MVLFLQGSPQLLYQRPYDPVVVPVQNQQMAVANSPLVALSQPSYAPARIPPVVTGGQSQGPNMFRHALLQVMYPVNIMLGIKLIILFPLL